MIAISTDKVDVVETRGDPSTRTELAATFDRRNRIKGLERPPSAAARDEHGERRPAARGQDYATTPSATNKDGRKLRIRLWTVTDV